MDEPEHITALRRELDRLADRTRTGQCPRCGRDVRRAAMSTELTPHICEPHNSKSNREEPTMTAPTADQMTPIKRCQEILDGLDTGNTTDEVRADAEKLMCDLLAGVAPTEAEIEPADYPQTAGV